MFEGMLASIVEAHRGALTNDRNAANYFFFAAGAAFLVVVALTVFCVVFFLTAFGDLSPII